jgi:hypothetical protein
MTCHTLANLQIIVPNSVIKSSLPAIVLSSDEISAMPLASHEIQPNEVIRKNEHIQDLI